MIYQEFKPIEPLDRFIQCFTVFETAPDEKIEEVIMPDGIVELVFHFGNIMTTTVNGSTISQPAQFAISQMQYPVAIKSNGATGYISARFYPWGAHHFFGFGISEFLDHSIEASLLWQTNELYENIQNAKSIRDKINVLQSFLLYQLNRNGKSQAFDEVVKFFRNDGIFQNLNVIRQKLGYSKKQLERNFLTSVGTSPQLFLRNSRFLHLCNNLGNGNTKSLTELAYQYGFYDQAHFNHDFKLFSGMTPGEFRNNIPKFASMN